MSLQLQLGSDWIVPGRRCPEPNSPVSEPAGGLHRVSLAQAYLELVRERAQPGVREILDGMALSARRGTGVQVHRAFPSADALVKTGTAACTHSRHAPGDGFSVVLVPADDPQILLLVRVHGVPGAQVAKTAGQMLRRIEN
jgi:hypothetical protein